MTLADDVAAVVERVRRERGVGVSDAINDLVRAGLVATPATAGGFRQSTSGMGQAMIPLDDVQAAIDALEGDTRR